MNIKIKPPVKADKGYKVKAPWSLRQECEEYVDLECFSPVLYLLCQPEPVYVQTLVSFERDCDGRAVGCSATVQINMPDGEHKEVYDTQLAVHKMFLECFEEAGELGTKMHPQEGL